MINLQKLLTYEEFNELQKYIQDASEVKLEELVSSFDFITSYQKQILDTFPTVESIENYPADIIRIGLIKNDKEVDHEELSKMSFEELSDYYDESITISKEELLDLREQAIIYRDTVEGFQKRINIFKSINRKLQPVKEYYKNEESWNNQ